MTNGNGRDALGLTLDAADVFEQSVAMVFYSDPGVGKSTAAVQSFQRGLFVCSAPTVLRPYASWWALRAAEAAKRSETFPFRPIEQIARKTIPDPSVLAANGTNTRAFVTAIVESFVATAQAGTNPYEALIFDEWSTLAARIFADVNADPRFGKNVWARIGEIKTFHRWICSIPRITHKTLVLVCHAQAPRYFDADDAGLPVAQRGALQYKGGPQMPIGSLVQPVCAEADVVVQMVVAPPDAGDIAPRRRFLTAADPVWERKFRDFRVAPVVDAEEAGLRKLLAQTGYLTV